MKFYIFVLTVNAVQVLLFQQNDYKIIHERASIDWYNPDYFKDLNLILFHYTRYQKRFNGSGFVLQDLGYDLSQTVQAYKFQSNEYREFPMVYTGGACNDIKYDTFGTSPVHFDTNYVGCPVKKGFYYIANVYLDDSKFPPFAPRGRFMLELSVYYNKTILLSRLKWYGAVEPTNPLEKIISG